MITDIQLSTLVLIAAIVWASLLVLKGTPLSVNIFEPFSTVTGVLVLMLGFFDKWAWHWKIFYPWLVSTPYLQGTWKGRLFSNWVNPRTQQQTESIDAYLVIRQKFSRVFARLLTRESSSELLAGEIVKNVDETWQFVGTYRNTPKILIRDRSPIHHGGIIMTVKGQPPMGMEGQYWTDRGTQGEVIFSGFNKNKFDDFNSATSAFYIKR